MGENTRLREITIEGPGVSDERTLCVHEWPGSLCFSELVVVLDEIAEMSSRPEIVRFDGFALSSETIGLLEYARMRRLHPRIRLSDESLSDEAIEELSLETGAVIVIPVEASVSPEPGDSAIRRAEHAAAFGASVEIETLLRPADLHALPALAKFVKASGFGWWNLDFLGPTARRAGLLSWRETARAFSSLAAFRTRMSVCLEVREAPSFRRFLNERRRRKVYEETGDVRVITSGETLFISTSGEVMPGKALRIPVGNVRSSELERINEHSSLLASIRDPQQLRGRCGACEMNQICGGSRARAWRVTQDMFAEDPGCFRAPLRKNHAHPDTRRTDLRELSY